MSTAGGRRSSSSHEPETAGKESVSCLPVVSFGSSGNGAEFTRHRLECDFGDGDDDYSQDLEPQSEAHNSAAASLITLVVGSCDDKTAAKRHPGWSEAAAMEAADSDCCKKPDLRASPPRGLLPVETATTLVAAPNSWRLSGTKRFPKYTPQLI